MKIYSKFEYKNMIRFQVAKDRFLFPLVKLLLRLHISANLISIFSGIVAVISLFFSVIFSTPLIFIIGIWFHLFLDGLDGSLARLSDKKPVATGLLMDLIFDSVGIATIGFYVLYFNYVNILVALIFISAYLGVNTISYVFAKTGKEYDFVVRPRIYVLIALVLDYIFSASITPIIVLVSSGLLVIFFLIGIKKIFKL